MAREGTRHPRVLVCVVPDSSANATLDSIARRNNKLIVCLLLREQRVGLRKSHADIELRDGDFDAERDEGLKLLLEVCRNLTDDEVTLEADTVNWHVVSLKGLHEIEECGSLRTRIFDVVLVNI